MLIAIVIGGLVGAGLGSKAGIAGAIGLGLILALIFGIVFAVVVPISPIIAAQNEMQPTPGPKYTPPDKKYCGEDMVRYYGLMFATSSASRFITMRNLADGSFDKTPLGQTADSIDNEIDKIGQRLKDKDCYFYKGGGSVFMDYKLTRDSWFGIGEESAWTHANINTNMTADQVIDICIRQVSTWWP